MPLDWHWIRLLVAVIAFSLPLSGCGNGMAGVSGTVTLDGKPMVGDRDHRITVLFVPESGAGPSATARLDGSGHYQLATGSQSGITPGAYLVTVTAVEVQRSSDPNSPPAMRRVSPERYADPKKSGFRADVQSGSNTFDFDLKSATSG